MLDYNKLALKAVELQKINKIKEAKKIYKDLLKIKKNPQILRLLGIIEYEEKNYVESLKLLNDCLKIDPKNSECYSNRGVVHFALRNFDEAILDYKKSIDINNKNYTHLRLDLVSPPVVLYAFPCITCALLPTRIEYFFPLTWYLPSAFFWCLLTIIIFV